MSEKDSLTFAGDYTIDFASILTPEGVELNVVKQVASIVIYEDIFSPFITGTLFLRDTFDLPNIFGRGGMNILKLKIYTPTIEESKKINLVCHIYKHGDRVAVGDRTQQYALHFISEESLQNQRKISAAFSGNPADITTRIVRDYLRSRKPIVTSIASNDIKYVSNFWNPSKNLQYVSEHARGKYGENFLFFENREGFNFASMGELSNKTISPIQKFSDSEYVATSLNKQTPQNVVRDVNKDYVSVLSLNVDALYDYMQDYDAGMIKSKMYIADPVKKKLTVKEFNLLQESKNLLNENQLYSSYVVNNSYPAIISGTAQYGTMGAGDSTNLSYLQKRITQVRRLQSSKIEIEVFGRTDYTVGKKVSLESEQLKPFAKSDDIEELLDRTISGNYIISAIAHKFTADKHICTLELLKDSTKLK